MSAEEDGNEVVVMLFPVILAKSARSSICLKDFPGVDVRCQLHQCDEDKCWHSEIHPLRAPSAIQQNHFASTRVLDCSLGCPIFYCLDFDLSFTEKE